MASAPPLESVQEDTYCYTDPDSYPGYMNNGCSVNIFEEEQNKPKTMSLNMFGSLFGVARAPLKTRQQLTDKWYKIIRRWYPDLHKNVYCAPPIHFKQVSYKPKPEKPYTPEEPYLRFGMRMYLPTTYSTTKDDEAQQRVLWTLSTFAKNKHVAAFVLSNMEFQNYLNKDYTFLDSTKTDFPKPDITRKDEEGEIDALVIDKDNGVFVLEVKAMGDPDEERKQTEEDKMVDLSDKLLKRGKQVKKNMRVVRKLLSDLDPAGKIKVRGGFVFANVSREIFDRALNKFPDAAEELMKSLDVKDLKKISESTFCSDDLPDRHVDGSSAMPDDKFHKIDKVWTALQSITGESEPMSDDLYEQICARLHQLKNMQILQHQPPLKAETLSLHFCRLRQLKNMQILQHQPLLKAAPASFHRGKPIAQLTPRAKTLTGPTQERAQFFHRLQEQINDSSSFEELLNVARQHKKEINNYKIAARDLFAHNFEIDKVSQQLYPEDGPQMLPVKIYGDGNCLPRTGSVLAFGNEEQHTEMRARITCELALHEDLYLDDNYISHGHESVKHPTKFYAQYCETFAFEELTGLAIKRLFKNELMHVRSQGKSVGPWHVHALSSVLGTAIQAIYPTYGGYNVRPHLHRLIFPWQQAETVPAFVPGIMWTHIHGKNVAAVSWRPNHFVACLPTPASDQSGQSAVPPFIDSLKPGDFVKVRVPKETGDSVEFIAHAHDNRQILVTCNAHIARVLKRFCGPLTTVKIYTEKTYPRVRLQITPKAKKDNGKGKSKGKKSSKDKPKVKLITEEAITKAGAARIMARRFSELVLLEEQIEVLQRNEEFVHLEGPPGTGKTLVLLLRILTWLDDGHMVWLLSLSPASRSITHVLMDQVQKMIDMYQDQSTAEDLKKRLRMFLLIRPKASLDDEYYRRRLMKFRLRAKTPITRPYVGYPRPPTLPPVALPHDRKVCLVLDESGMEGIGLDDFFNEVCRSHKEGLFRCPEFKKGLNVWSASLEKAGRPTYVAKPGETTEDKFGVLWELQLPLRCPPTIQKALMLVQPSLDQKNVCCFRKEAMLSHPAKQKDCKDREQYIAEGLPVYLIAHGNHKRAHEDIWFCYECGADLADYLKNTLRIGEEECDCDDKDVCYDENAPENCPDCGKATKGNLPASDLPLKYNDVIIVATQKAFLFSLPLGGFVQAMAKKKLKVAVSTTRKEGDAPIPPNEVILISDVTSIHGLERAVVIVIPEVKPPPPMPMKYREIFPELQKDYEKEDLPKNMQAAITTGEAEGKEGIILTPDGAVEEEMQDEAEESSPVENVPIDPEFVKRDPQIKEAIEKGEDVTMTAEGAVEEDLPDEDVEMKDENSPDAGDSSQNDQPSSSAAASSQDPNEPRDGKDPTIPVGEKDPCTYTDSFSEQQIKAALESMSLRSRKDVFYIGSRAVCQLILIHPGKDPHKEDRSEPMETDQKP